MSSYNASYPSSLPIAFTPSPVPATLAGNDTNQPEPYLTSQMTTSSPASTGCTKARTGLKGKRVHTCEHPGCSRIFTRAEHRRRHELSHDPTKQYRCTYEGCGKEFHRADYLNQHLSRHKAANAKGKKSQSRSRQSLCQSSAQQNLLPLRPAGPSSLPLAEPPSNSSRAWGSFDSNYSYSQSSRAPSMSSIDEYPSPYSYPGGACSSPPLTNTFTTPYPSSGMSAEMMTAVDQYLRSVLKPEAFAVPPQPLNSAIWSPTLEIDPTLTKIETQDQIPMDSWPPSNLPYESNPTQMDQVAWHNPRPFEYRD